MILKSIRNISLKSAVCVLFITALFLILPFSGCSKTPAQEEPVVMESVIRENIAEQTE